MAFCNTLFTFPFSAFVSTGQQKDVITCSSKSFSYNQITPHDFNLASTPSKEYMVVREEKLKEVDSFFPKSENQLECMMMIDILQQYALDYHFEDEIHDILRRYHRRLIAGGGVSSLHNDNNLFMVSLCFRLLRQNGYPVPSDVFNIFVEGNGEFRAQLRCDLQGMISLYQASQLEMNGEDILIQANAFTTNYLRNYMKGDQARVISHILDHPYHMTLPRFNVKNWLNIHKDERGTFGFKLQDLAKVDFNLVQSLHQGELVQVLQWWRELGLTQELSFARDQPVKWYMWAMAALENPMFTEERINLTKSLSLIYIMDDIFDCYGTLDQLVLFTEAINKWDIDTLEQLPRPMKVFMKILFDTTADISFKIQRKHGRNPNQSLRNVWTCLCNTFLVEAKCFASEVLPTSQEYLNNAVITSGVPVFLSHIFYLLGQDVNKQTVNLLDKVPGLIYYPGTILRLWDDLGSAEDENQHGHDGSYIACYMKEHSSATVESAREHVMDIISTTWKTLKQEYISSSVFSMDFRKASLNTARMVCLMYSYDENQRLPVLENHIKSVLYESIPFHSN